MTIERWPTEMSDRLLHAWNGAGFGWMQIGLDLELERAPDAERLALAFERLRAWEPLVGCRFAEDPATGRTWWEPAASYRPLTVTEDEAVYERFRTTPHDATTEASIRACLARTGTGARLSLVIAHELSDAAGFKELAAALARFYDEPGTALPARAAGTRAMAQVLSQLGPRERLDAALDGLELLARTTVPWRTAVLEQRGDEAEGFCWAVHHVGREATGAAAAWGRTRGATINDLATAAFLVAVSRAASAPAGARSRVMSTVDLRRYLPERRAPRPCNLSGFEVLTLGGVRGASFGDVLDQVVRRTSARKRRMIGLGAAGGAPWLERLEQPGMNRLFRVLFEGWRRSGNFPPSLTNMGRLDERALSFDGRPPRRAWLLVPAHVPPHVGIGVSGYGGTLTLSAATTPSFAPRMNDLLRETAELLARAGQGRAG